MESVATTLVSLTVIVGMNLLVALLVWSEYSDHRERYLRFVAVGQSCIFLWHLLSAWMVYTSDGPIKLALSLTTFFLAVYYFLAAALYQHLAQESRVHKLAAICAVVILVSGSISLTVLNGFWALNALLLLAAPVATLVYFNLPSRRLIALFQVAIFSLFISSVAFFQFEFQVAGGLMYLLMGMFQSILPVIFIMSSIRQSRRQIADRERDYRVFFESVNEVYFRLDQVGCIQEVSPSVSQFGYQADEMQGKNLFDFLTDAQEFQSRLNNIGLQKKPERYTGKFLSRGAPFDCEIICSEVLNEETGQRHLAGSIRNTQERNQLEQQFIEAQRRESLGILAGGMAHDFNNLLQGIVGHTQILMGAKTTDKTLYQQGFDAILAASTTAGSLCRQLLQYTGKIVTPETRVNLTETMSEVIDIMEPSVPEGVGLETRFPDEPAMVKGDRSQVGQIVLNLVHNALDSVGEEGAIVVSHERRSLDQNAISALELPMDMLPGDYHVIRVADSGAGIDPAMKGKIFDPFVTNKKSGHGLGLSAVTGITRNHGGGITCVSEPGKGCEFSVFLPVTNGVSSVTLSEKAAPTSHKQLILVVDDDSTVRHVTCGILEQAGHRVLQAENGVEALLLFGVTSEAIDLLITDIRMPKMDGIELAHKLKKQVCELPVILISAYADVTDALDRTQSLSFQFLGKPFLAEQLLEAVEKAAEQKHQLRYKAARAV